MEDIFFSCVLLVSFWKDKDLGFQIAPRGTGKAMSWTPVTSGYPVMSQLLREIKQPYRAVSGNRLAGATSKRWLRVSDCMLLYCKSYLLSLLYICLFSK